jgi:hypothetical protein
MMAKKEKVTFEIPNIKLAQGKTAKKNKPERPIIESPVLKDDMTVYDPAVDDDYEGTKITVVDKAIEVCQQIESLNSELGEYETIIKNTAAAEQKRNLDDDNFVKTVDVQGTAFKIQVQFRDSYSKMDVSMKEPLKAIFGEKYPLMFEDIHSETLRPEKYEELKKILGPRFTDFFDVEDAVKPTKEFQYNYFALKKTLKPEQTATVAKVLEVCQNNPAIKYPK